MAGKNRAEYVRYYAAGTAAHKIEQKPRRRTAEQVVPKPKTEPVAIPFDPVAVFGTTVAIVMVLCVLIGFLQINHVNDEIAAMEQTISELKSQQYTLQKQYNSKVDLEDIRVTAEAMGLVPIREVRHITISIPEPEVVEELPWWEEMWNDFKAMFE